MPRSTVLFIVTRLTAVYNKHAIVERMHEFGLAWWGGDNMMGMVTVIAGMG